MFLCNIAVTLFVLSLLALAVFSKPAFVRQDTKIHRAEDGSPITNYCAGDYCDDEPNDGDLVFGDFNDGKQPVFNELVTPIKSNPSFLPITNGCYEDRCNYEANNLLEIVGTKSRVEPVIEKQVYIVSDLAPITNQRNEGSNEEFTRYWRQSAYSEDY